MTPRVCPKNASRNQTVTSVHRPHHYRVFLSPLNETKPLREAYKVWEMTGPSPSPRDLWLPASFTMPNNGYETKVRRAAQPHSPSLIPATHCRRFVQQKVIVLRHRHPVGVLYKSREVTVLLANRADGHSRPFFVSISVCKVVFVGVVGEVGRSDVSVDSIRMSSDPCPRELTELGRKAFPLSG